MTHYIVAATGTAGDVFPFVEIGRELQRRGEKVTLVTSPYFKSEVLESGVSFRKFGTLKQTRELFANPELWTEERGFIALWKGCIESNMEVLAECARQSDGPENVVIICHFNLMPVADLARAAKGKLKIIACYLSPGTIRSDFGKLNIGTVEIDENYPSALKAKLFSWVDKNYFNTAILPSLNEYREKLNLPAVDNLISHIQTAADAYVTLFPNWYRGKERDWPVPLIEGDFMFYRSKEEPESSGRFQKFLETNKHPILFTAGTAHSSAIAFFENAKKAVNKLGRSAIFLTKRREQLPEKLGKNIIWLKYFELSRLLKISAVCVSHGGIGTVAEAMRAGVPQLIVPFAHDQFDNGRIVTELEVGNVIPAKQLTSEHLEKSLAELLQDKEIEAECMGIAKKLQSNNASAALVEKIISCI